MHGQYRSRKLFGETGVLTRTFSWGDAFVLGALSALILVGVQISLSAPTPERSSEISLSPYALPWYTLLSFSRMLCAYVLSLGFALVYGRIAATHKSASRILIPLLDVLQSVPILSFLPMVLLSMTVFLPTRVAAELASIVLIFTSQVWNLVFTWYQSLITVPRELIEASSIFRFNKWLRFRILELPCGASGLVWNSIVSWAGGWFFLMAAESFTLGHHDFRLPGLGSFLQEAARVGDSRALWWGFGTLVALVVVLNECVWRPLVVWSERFRLDLAQGERPSTSWFLELLRNAKLLSLAYRSTTAPLLRRIDTYFFARSQKARRTTKRAASPTLSWQVMSVSTMVLAVVCLYYTSHLLTAITLAEWRAIAVGTIATFLRVFLALCVALMWTIPFGVLIGTRKEMTPWLQPIVQILASIPSTALFPFILMHASAANVSLSVTAIFLMLLGTQWYLLFNVIAGAAAIPQDFHNLAALLRMSGFMRWRYVVLPSLFPFLISGSVMASGGAWNASVVAEYVTYGGHSEWTTGIGALIAKATAAGNYPLLLGATLTMVMTVVMVNRFVWRKLYRLAQLRYRME